MKKAFVVLTVALLAVSLFVGCSPESDGNADGIVFYDCDADNSSENGGAGPDKLKSSECGWRYLIAASEDLPQKYTWISSNSSNNYSTKTEIGEGYNNTYDVLSDAGITGFPAANACVNYRGGGHADWFLPSLEELKLMYTNLKAEGKGGTWHVGTNDAYWSSSDTTIAGGNSYILYFTDGEDSTYSRTVDYYVRPVRRSM